MFFFFLLLQLQVLLLPRMAIKATSLLELSSLIVLLLPDSCLSCSVVFQVKLSHSEIIKMPAGIGTPEERGEKVPEGEKNHVNDLRDGFNTVARCSASTLSKLFTALLRAASIKPRGGWYRTFRCFPGCFFGLYAGVKQNLHARVTLVLSKCQLVVQQSHNLRSESALQPFWGVYEDWSLFFFLEKPGPNCASNCP